MDRGGVVGVAREHRLQHLDRASQLDPVLAVFPNPNDRDFVAKHIFDTLEDQDNALPNTGGSVYIKPGTYSGFVTVVKPSVADELDHW